MGGDEQSAWQNVTRNSTRTVWLMPDKGTRNAMFLLRRMSERAIEKKNDICMFH